MKKKICDLSNNVNCLARMVQKAVGDSLSGGTGERLLKLKSGKTCFHLNGLKWLITE